MVAISLYKGNLHKVPNVPRRWLCPAPKISLKDFRTLLRRRDRTLSRLRASNPNHVRATDSGNPDKLQAPADDAVAEGNGFNCGNHIDNPCSEPELNGESGKDEGNAKGNGSVGGQDCLKELDEKNIVVVKVEKKEDNVNNEEKTEVPLNTAVEKVKTESDMIEVEKRKKEVEEKLEILNEKKHSLVQVLKQILNAEEQLKRQNSPQGMSTRLPSSLQVDTTTDSVSMSRLNTPRMGSDGNPSGDAEGGGEADDASNQNSQSRHLHRTSSTSPSSDAHQRKPTPNMVPHFHRTTLGVASSPSRFAPAGQGHSSVSVSGASYVASSPSPAASGGTSVFRDGRLPSPWN